MPGEGISANVNGRLEALDTGAADAAVRLSALAAATAAAPAAAQVTARRRRCLVMFMNSPLCQRRRQGDAAGVGQGYAAPGSPGSEFFPDFFIEPSAPPGAYLLRDVSFKTADPDGATRCGQQCDLAPPTTRS